jgi:hypothetical protein
VVKVDVSDMKLKEHEKLLDRELIIEPVCKLVDREGRVYVGTKYAQREVVIFAVEMEPEDKIEYLKLGRK